MIEEQIQFTVEGQRLYGMLHLPDGRGPFPALCFFHGFTGQRIEPHRLFVKTARKLAAEGFVVLRFDFRGSGESEGDFRDMTISGEIKDALASLDFLASQPQVDSSRMGVLGLSLGGFVASHVASQNRLVKTLVLWAAGARPPRFFPNYVHLAEKNREQWRKKGEWDFGGMVLGAGFLKDLKKVENLLPKLARFKGKALVIHGELDATVPVSEAEAYRKALGRRAVLHILKGADHTFNRKSWEEEVIDRTAKWLKQKL
jgi:uncharacterized protein